MSLEIELDFREYEAFINSYPETMRAPLKMQLEHGIDEALEYVKSTWSAVTYGKRMPGMTHVFYDPEYAPTLKIERQGFRARVYTEYQGATEIQHGRPSIDLKPGLLSGPGAKTNAKGQSYNVVPFSHASPHSSSIKALPEDVYRAALRGQKIPANSEMGTRNTRSGWSVGPYANLRRESKGRYSTYRTVSESQIGSRKWVIPQLPPIDVVSAVQSFTEPHLQEIITRYLS